VTVTGARKPEVLQAVGDVPTIVIEPSRTLFKLDLQALWEYRELVYFMVWKDVKSRYKQTALGIAWAVLQPILTMLIFTVIFSYVARIRTHGISYPMFAFAALVPWTYFSQAVSRTGAGMVSTANLISKVYFPRLIIPLSTAATPMVDFALAFLVLLGMMLWFQHVPPAVVVLLPAFMLMAFLAAIGFGLWLSALNVRYRDVQHLIPFVVQTGMLASPVAYPVSLVPAQWQALYSLNPMVAVIEGFRWCLLGAPAPDLTMIALGLLTTTVLILGGLVYFNATEKTFADII
jgi:lipopolysaccharide transport system permease protein